MSLLIRYAEQSRPSVRFFLDGQAVSALAGDTLLTAVLTVRERLRTTEFTGSPRAGFCMMGACQDCWVQVRRGDGPVQRLRACSTLLEADMSLSTTSAPPPVITGEPKP